MTSYYPEMRGIRFAQKGANHEIPNILVFNDNIAFGIIAS